MLSFSCLFSFLSHRLQDLTVRDLEKQEREKAANSLEAFIFETQDKLYQPEYQEVSTTEQREEISGKLSAASTWLEDEGFGATTVVRGLLGYDRWDGNSLLPGSKKVRKLGSKTIKKVAGLPPGLFCFL